MSLKESIKKHEGFRSKVYKDTLGFDTVGYGFKCDSLSPDELVINGNKYEPMSEFIADMILDKKLEKLQKQVYTAVPWLKTAPQPVGEVISEMAYQMGINGVLGFKNTLAMLQAKKYKDAASNMLLSKWAKQTPNRAKELSDKIANLG